jgi:diguanylate cyclase
MTIGLEGVRRFLDRRILRPRASAAVAHAPATAREEASPASVRSGLWKAYLAIGLALTAGYFALPTRELQNLNYQVPEMLGVLAMFGGILIHRPHDPRPWILLTVGLALSTTGDWTWVILSVGYGIQPFPSVADVFYLAGDAFVIVGLLAMVHKRLPGGDRAGVLDALIVAIGVGLLSWVFVMAPTVATTGGGALEISVALAYPVADIVLLGMLVRLFLAPSRPSTASTLLVAALVAWLVGDFIYAFLALNNGYQAGDPLDATWLVASAFFGAAALHPSMRRVAAPAERTEVRFSAVRFAVLGAASLMAPAVLVIQWSLGRPIDVPVIAGGSVIMFLLVIARLGVLVSDLRTTLRQRDALEVELERRSLTDPLTGLPNRVLFHDRLTHALSQRNGKAAVLFLDVDDFKTVNDTAGHEAGDTVLRSIADAIRGTLRPGDTAARLGGDEFGILLEDGPDAYGAGQVAERLLSAIQAPTEVANRDYTIGASIGISLGDASTSDAQALMREADIAMYVAKGQGKGRFTVFEPSTHAPVLRSLELRADMEQAIREHQFELFYQPIVSLSTGEIAGVEALVRWRHPTRGLLEPADFIPLAEATGAIVPMGKWILEQACREAARWWGIGRVQPFGSSLGSSLDSSLGSSLGSSRRPGGGAYVSVNLSPLQIAQPGFSGFVAEVLASTGLSARQLVLETTESARLDQEGALASLRTLRAMGVRLAIDDFGTGYASLSQLRRIPFDILKIDQSFVADLSDPATAPVHPAAAPAPAPVPAPSISSASAAASSDARNARAESLLTGIVDMARRLNVACVAEGIENARQLSLLREIGCGFGQGYHFSEPLPVADFRALLQVAGGLATNGSRSRARHTGLAPHPRSFARALPEL